MSHPIFDCPTDHAGAALQSSNSKLTRNTLESASQTLARRLQQDEYRCVALYADNGADWVVADLGCQLASVALLPLPLFFSFQQIEHAVQLCGADGILTHEPGLMLRIFPEFVIQKTELGELTLLKRKLTAEPSPLPLGTAKITFTSGSTGQPKGVCLTSSQQLEVASSLVGQIGLTHSRHLCLLPLSTLLENVAGVYAPLLSAGEVIVPSLEEVGLSGSSSLQIPRLLNAIDFWRPNSLILLPQTLLALTNAVSKGWRPPSSLDFVAVGGARVSPELLMKAKSLGLPVYEGYGLSECASVVSLNRLDEERVGSCGKPLPHSKVRIDDGEICVDGNSFLGYVGQPETWNLNEVRTGDLGYLDEDGFLHLQGRLKNLIITSFGRNIHPEWVESELLANPALLQAVVVGESRPYCSALICPRDRSVSNNTIERWLAEVNAGLPDYARIRAWHRLSAPLSVAQKTLTENGRPRRVEINRRFNSVIQALYQN